MLAHEHKGNLLWEVDSDCNWKQELLTKPKLSERKAACCAETVDLINQQIVMFLCAEFQDCACKIAYNL